jgi:hypothetical protein
LVDNSIIKVVPDGFPLGAQATLMEVILTAVKVEGKVTGTVARVAVDMVLV